MLSCVFPFSAGELQVECCRRPSSCHHLPEMLPVSTSWSSCCPTSSYHVLLVKALQPKFNSFTKNISAQLSIVVPHVEMKHVIAATIGLKGVGGLRFGAYLLVNDGGAPSQTWRSCTVDKVTHPEFLRRFLAKQLGSVRGVAVA